MAIVENHCKDVVKKGLLAKIKRKIKPEEKEARDLIIAMNPYLEQSSGIREIIKELDTGSESRLPLELGSVLSIPFKNTTGQESLLHLAICHENTPGGWDKTPEYLNQCFDKILEHESKDGVQKKKYDVVRIGSGLGETYGANKAEIFKVMANTKLEMSLCIAPKGAKWPTLWSEAFQLIIKGIIALG